MSRLLTATLAFALVGGLALTASSGDGQDVVSFTNTAQERQDEPQEEGRRPGRRHHRGPLGHAIHGELIVPEREGDGFETVVMDAGEVTEVDEDSLTLERPDGEAVTVRLSEDTRRRGDAVEVGDRVRVVADEEGNARVVMGGRRENS